MGAKKLKTAAIDVPANRAEVEALLGEIGRLQRLVGLTEIGLNNTVARLKEHAELKVAPLNEAITTAFERVHAWAEAHRDELLEGKSKTARLATGELSWRMNPPSVSVKGTEAVLEALRKHGLGRFIRTVDEINKQAVLDEPSAVEGIKGLSIKQSEVFVAKPFETEIEVAETVKRSA